MQAMRELLQKTRVNASMLEELLSSKFRVSSPEAVAPLEAGNLKPETALGQTVAQLLKRPEVEIEMLAPVLMRLVPKFFERADSNQRLVAGSDAAGQTSERIHDKRSTIH